MSDENRLKEIENEIMNIKKENKNYYDSLSAKIHFFFFIFIVFSVWIIWSI